MCGIAGVYSFKATIQESLRYIPRCLSTMRRRGPDSEGVWDDGSNYVAGFVRLAIRDLSVHGDQPMRSSCGNYCLSFNGEIYNAEKFRPLLVAKGVDFISTADTEVLLYGLIHFGIDYVVAEFDGMFAFAFFDNEQKQLILARDRVGIKPLYVGFDGDENIIYSSQYDHVINFNSLRDASLNPEAIGCYLQLGYVPDMMGAVKGTILFPHGHYAIVNDKGFKLKKYYSVITQFEKGKLNTIDEEIYQSSVKDQLISDVPVATYLSSGVDSALVTLWANSILPVASFTIGTNDAYTDETAAVEHFAASKGFNHSLRKIREDDFLALIPSYFESHSEPFADFSSLPSLLLSQWLKPTHKVALSGDGPDELYWGYSRNTKYLKAGREFFSSKLVLASKLAYSKITGSKSIISRNMISKNDFIDFYYPSQFLYGSKIVPDIFKGGAGEPFFLNELRSAYSTQDQRTSFPYIIRDMELNINLQRILLKVDRSGMFNSVEVRVPYLGNKVMDLSLQEQMPAQVSGGVGKFYLKQLLEQYSGASYAFKEKKGFLVPMREWLRGEIKKDLYEKLMNMPNELSALFERGRLKYYLDRHIAYQEDLSGILWAIYALVNWYLVHRNKIELRN